MQRQNYRLDQKQSLQQRLSPQQIQYIKLLQLPTVGLEQRIKEELELNPVLEELEEDEMTDALESGSEEWEEQAEEQAEESESEPDPVDRNEEIDWDSFLHNTEYDGQGYSAPSGSEEWRDLPNPYHATFLEQLEEQVTLLDLDDTEELIADQILGSLDTDGYLRRDLDAIVDNIAFHHGVLTDIKQVEQVRKKIQRLEPVGVASVDLRDCLQVQLETSGRSDDVAGLALEIVENEWEAFQRKHFDRLKNRLSVSDEELKGAFRLIRNLDPKPGSGSSQEEESGSIIEPDFEVWFKPGEDDEDDEEGDFVIRLNQRNVPPLRVSPKYRELWEELKQGKRTGDGGRTRSFIKEKVESAQWFIDSIRQRQQTLTKTMRTIVSLQEEFFKYGEGLRPMILKDIAERVGMDISTISRVVNGKYVQTPFGVYELKYFFSEGLQTEGGEEVSSHEVKKFLLELIEKEDKTKPLSDQELAEMLKKRGFRVARRTVSKYREKLNLPVARLRKQII